MYKFHEEQYKHARARWKLRPEPTAIDAATEKSVLDVLKNGPWYNSGEESESLEKEFAERFQTKYALSCNSGTAAWHIILIACGIGQGDEVIIPTNVYFTVVSAVVREGGKPVLMDIEEETYNLDPIKTEEAITPKTKAIVITNMAGHPADIDAFMKIGREYDIKIISDSCKSIGARYKGKPHCSIPDASFTSMGGKKIGSFGPAGMMMTNDKELADKFYLIRNNGTDAWGSHQTYYFFGLHYEIGEVNAAVARHQLRKFDGWLEKRRANAKLINDILEDVTEVQLPIEKPWAFHNYYVFYLKIPEKREKLSRYLKEKGFHAKFQGPGHYPFIHMQKPVQERFGYKEGDFPILESQVGRLLDLNVNWNKTEEELSYVANLIKNFYSH